MTASPETLFAGTLTSLQDWSSHCAKDILHQLDESLDASVCFVAISPNVLVGPQSIPSSDIRKAIYFIGDLNLTNLDETFYFSFRTRTRDYDKVLRERESLSSTTTDRRQEAERTGEAIGLALENTLNEQEHLNKDIYFAEKAIWRNHERVFVSPVLQVDRRSYSSRYRLQRPLTFNRHSVSLLDLTINQILQACIIGLRSSNTDVFYNFTTFARNILVDSARAIMNVSDAMNLDMFRDCNLISALPYESREGTGKLLIAKHPHRNIVPEVVFKKPIELSDHRMARKILEMAQEDLSLLCDGIAIYGLGQTTGQYDSQNEDLFVVEFIKQDHWRLLHDSRKLMTVIRGQPRLPVPKISKEKFQTEFERHFDASGDHALIYALVEAATKQKHGTMLVVSDRATDEAARLGGQVEPFLLPVKNVHPLTAIDGAMLIEPSGLCHGVGTILDGQADQSWEPSRGARYNSAVRYLSTKRKEGHRCMAIVISEDGMINLL